MPAHHAKKPPLVVANARHSPLWLRFAPRSGAFWRAALAHPKNSQPLMRQSDRVSIKPMSLLLISASMSIRINMRSATLPMPVM